MALLCALALAGCSKTSHMNAPAAGPSDHSADQAMVASTVADQPAMVDEDVYESNDPTATDPAGPGLDAINPLRFWRTIRRVERSYEFNFTDPDTNGRPTRAIVTVHKRLLGAFNILVGDTTATDTTRALIHKPLDDRWVRRLALLRVRVSEEDSTHSRWRLVGTSGVKVTSLDATTRILSLRIQAGVVDTTITDPLELHRLRNLIKLPGDTPVRLTVTTNHTDDVVLLYRWMNRRRFTNNGDGTYSAQFMTGDFPGLRHVGVNALTHGTLFDDTAPYDSQAWILPFVVRGDGDIVAMR
jgi:hypothetical protein